MIAKEKLQNELLHLRQQEADALNQVVMVRGAIQLCEHLILECDKEVQDEENL